MVGCVIVIPRAAVLWAINPGAVTFSESVPAAIGRPAIPPCAGPLAEV